LDENLQKTFLSGILDQLSDRGLSKYILDAKCWVIDRSEAWKKRPVSSIYLHKLFMHNNRVLDPFAEFAMQALKYPSSEIINTDLCIRLPKFGQHWCRCKLKAEDQLVYTYNAIFPSKAQKYNYIALFPVKLNSSDELLELQRTVQQLHKKVIDLEGRNRDLEKKFCVFEQSISSRSCSCTHTPTKSSLVITPYSFYQDKK
jgi:hypothetical protein